MRFAELEDVPVGTVVTGLLKEGKPTKTRFIVLSKDSTSAILKRCDSENAICLHLSCAVGLVEGSAE